MKKTNYIAIGAAALTAVSVFLPWLELSSSASFMGQSASFSSGAISGISISGGMFGLILALVGGFLALKNSKWAFMAGLINFITGLGYIIGWFGHNDFNTSVGFNSSFGGGSARAGVDPQIGLYLFVLGSLIFVLFTLKNLKGAKPD